MSLSGIKDALNTQLAATTGVTTALRDAAGDTQPHAPEASQCPATLIEMRRPAYSTATIANGLTQYVWHFDIVIFGKPVGTGTHAERVKSVEDIPAAIRARLAGHNTLVSAATSVKFSSDGDLGYFQKFGVDFYGGVMHLDVFEDVAETYAA